VAQAFDVIAAGDFHEFRRLHPERLAFYSGSIERTSSNIWQETAPKGIVLWDTDYESEIERFGTIEFREITTRKVIDQTLAEMVRFNLERSSASIVGDLNLILEMIASRAVQQWIDGSIIRLRVDDFPRADRDGIDHKLIRRIRDRAVHFALDLRFASSEARAVARSGVRSLEAQAEAFFAAEPPDVRAHANRYLSGQE
jgi:DNA repair exonuclease SbcCD nuclease subunit